VVTFVLDASAVIRLLDGQAGSQRVRWIFAESRKGKSRMAISAVNWGEVIVFIAKRRDRQSLEALSARLIGFGLMVVQVDTDRAKRAGLIRVTHNIPYADACGVELAADSVEHILVTADFDVKPAERDVHIEFLPVRLKP